MNKNNNEKIFKTFILPLYGIKAKSIEEVYVNAYLNKEGSYLFLKVKELKECLANNLLYSGTLTHEEEIFYLFSTSKVYENDIQLVIQGKYSQLSKQAKTTIINLCGLEYMVREKDGSIACAEPLLALSKHKSLKSKIESKLQITLPGKAELFSKLTKEAFIDNLIIKE